MFNNECEILILAWKSFSFYLFFQTFMECCTVHTVLLMSSIFPKFLIHFEFISVSGVFFLGSLSFSFSFIRASENNFLLIFHWNESYRRFIQHNSSKYFFFISFTAIVPWTSWFPFLLLFYGSCTLHSSNDIIAGARNMKFIRWQC